MHAMQLRGTYLPIITPFASDGSVAIDSIERLCNEYLDAGVTGIVALGTTGEVATLEPQEREQVIDVCVQVCADRNAPLIIGAGTNSTAATVRAVEDLKDTQALIATLVMVPYYLRPSQAGIVEHFKAVAKASPVPMIIYNIPYRTGRDLEADGMLELANTPNIAGVKQAVGGIDANTMRILREAPESFAVLGGEDPYMFSLCLQGGAGAIAASAHVCTERFVSLVECGLAGKVDEGRAHHEALIPVVEACFAEPNPAVFKGVLHAQGRIPTPNLRLPLTNASQPAIDRAMHAIEAAQ